MSTPAKVEVIRDLLGGEDAAIHVGNRWHNLKVARAQWEAQCRETRNYVFATDTRTTSNASLPWRNTTTVPKLCQIRDNLHANYMAALFPRSDWLTWVPGNRESSMVDVAKLIKAYMRTKLEDSNFEDVVGQLLLDYIDYGNCFADVEYVVEKFDGPDGESEVGYQGPRVVRIDPMDIVFDISGRDFESTPKITRTLMSMGDLEKYLATHDEEDIKPDGLRKLREVRQSISAGGYSSAEVDAATGWSADGFGNMLNYFQSGYVELLEFEGDMYDELTGEYRSNVRMLIADRRYVLIDSKMRSYNGKSYKQHVGWRVRNGNLIAMGPLDNLVGIQYRIDHLQNVKSDIFDLTAAPPLKIKGLVQDFQWKPLERIHLEDDADVSALTLPVDALRANFDIDWLENKMEEMAGAPKQAMGFRTPGEKTAYEVQTLENNASRIFQAKIKQFERNFLEPLLNRMLAVARDNIATTDIARVVDDELGIRKFQEVDRDVLKSRGRLRPVGAQSFADKATVVQNLNNMFNSALGSNENVISHVDGYRLAKLLEEVLSLDEYDLVEENIAVVQAAEREKLIAQLQQDNAETMAQPGLAEEQAMQQEVADEFGF